MRRVPPVLVLTVGFFLRILCNGLCTAQRFQIEGKEQICRIQCCTICLPLCGDKQPCYHGEGHLFHDLITQVFLRSASIWDRGTWVSSMPSGTPLTTTAEILIILGTLDCMKGRSRFMRAITRAFAHAYQVTCLTRQMPVVASQKFRLPCAKARYPHLSNARTAARKRGNDFQGWAVYTDGGTRLADGETLAGVGVLSHDPAMEGLHGMFAPSHHGRSSSCIGRCQYSLPTNTAEMTAMSEALSFLGPHGPFARDANSCVFVDSKHAAGVAWARFRLAHTSSWRSPAKQLLLKVQHRLRITMQYVYGHAGNLGNECADHAAALGTFGLVSNHKPIYTLGSS